jgi:hypothetical protein
MEGFLFMANNNVTSDDRQTAAAKKPYEKPSFRHEKVFVTTALSCGKIASTQGSCGTLSAS